jgi:hypothetical protein
MNSQDPARQSWILYSRSATTPRVKFVPSGRASPSRRTGEFQFPALSEIGDGEAFEEWWEEAQFLSMRCCLYLLKKLCIQKFGWSVDY